MKRRSFCVGGAAALAGATVFPPCNPARAAVSQEPIRLGVLTDMSGIMADISGPGSVDAVRMAVQDFGGQVLGRPIDVVFADHQNRTDVGLNVARQWIDERSVLAVIDVPNSAVALAVSALTREKDRIALLTGPGTTQLSGAACSPNSVEWTFDTYSLATGQTSALLKSKNARRWFFITADYSFGHDLQNYATQTVQQHGGTVVGSVLSPIETTDFASYIMQAQASGADAIGLATTSTGTATILKQARDFGVDEKSHAIAAFALYITDVHAIGLDVAQGVYCEEAFYWDLNDATRVWSKRFFEHTKRMPTMLQAGSYGAVTHYLKAIQAAGTTDARPVMATMKNTPINDFMTKDGRIRPDGRVLRDMYLFQAKTPKESTGPWDCYNLVRTIPAVEATRPLSEGSCPLVASN